MELEPLKAVLPSEARIEDVNPALLAILCCPICKGDLRLQGTALDCGVCDRSYPIVFGIPDLRVYEDPLIPLDDDYRKSEKVQAQFERLSFAELVRYYWSLPTYPYTPPDLCEKFTAHVLSDEQRIESYVDAIGSGEAFLEVGCGTAALVRAASSRFRLAIGCDVAFRWLLIARSRLIEARVPANLVCCCADYLPFRAGFFDSVASVSLLEHVADAAAAVAEFGRVAQPGAHVFTWTTNRYSIAKEPHVQVWGVGFLPRRWMPAYVRWTSGLAYEKKRLLSRFELKHFLERAGCRAVRFFIPPVSDGDWKRLGAVEQFAVRMFRAGDRIPLLRGLVQFFYPVLVCKARQGPGGRV